MLDEQNAQQASMTGKSNSRALKLGCFLTIGDFMKKLLSLIMLIGTAGSLLAVTEQEIAAALIAKHAAKKAKKEENRSWKISRKARKDRQRAMSGDEESMQEYAYDKWGSYKLSPKHG